MIELKSISKFYGERQILSDINLRFECGKIYVIKGISGSGKTTLLNILGFIDNSYEGEYVLYDKIIDKNQSRKNRNEIGYLCQDSLLLSNLTVKENLMLINGNEELIEHYVLYLGLENLLQKKPEMLSGGERQRISIVRALLLSPQIILADEPTASLDGENADKVVSLLSEISDDKNIIIISTHEDCFDCIADEILVIDYGCIKTVLKQNYSEKKCRLPLSASGVCIDIRFYKKIILSLKRSINKIKPAKIISAALIVLFLFLCVSMQINFKREYVNYIYNHYPVHMFNANVKESSFKILSSKYDLKIYDNYTFKKNETLCYPLFDERDSVFTYGDFLIEGRLPKEDNEILVSKEFGNENYGSYNQCLKKREEFGGVVYTIVGVVDIVNSSQSVLFTSNHYYDSEVKNCAFIPYESIKEYGVSLNASDLKMISIQCNEDEKAEVISKLREDVGDTLSVWDSRIDKAQTTVSAIFGLVMLVVVIIALISMIFLNAEIQTELFYKKREIAYLQIFGIKRKTLTVFLVSERILNLILSFMVSIILYFIIMLLLDVLYGIDGYVNPLVLLVVVAVVMIYATVSSLIPIKNFMKKDIVDLMK